jgi:hypothetical protein
MIADVADPAAPVVLATRPVPGEFCHSVWPTGDGAFVYSTNEAPGGFVRVWDVAALPGVTPVGSYVADPAATVHNAQVDGDYLFVSYYTQGLRIADIRDPADPVEVQFYDTFPGTDAGPPWNGNWGVHAVEGRVAVSDLRNGLFLFRFTP